MITQILPSAFAVVGSAAFTDSLGLGARTGPVRRIVVLLVDGLGAHLIARSPHLSAVADLATIDELSCTMPSTTPTSLASLTTGAQPGEHGIIGFTVNVPATDRLLTHIFWRDDPDPSVWQPIPTTFERAGVPSAVVMAAAFADSGLTRATYRGAAFTGVGDKDDLVRTVLQVLPDNNLVFAYVSQVDTAAHVHGIDSAQWLDACAQVATMIERLEAALPHDAALLVTADHGGLDVPAGARADVDADGRLSAGLRLIAGEPRMRYLHTLEGAATDVAAAWTEVLGDSVSVVSREQAIDTGMFGTVTPTVADRIGDLVVTCLRDNAILATAHEPPAVAALVGMHGAATPAETAVPLMTFAHG